MGSRGGDTSGRGAARPRYARPRTGLPSRTGPPLGAGRWSLLPPPEEDRTRRATATAELLLDRHGIVTRGAVQAERVPGGFAGVYRVLSAFEEAGRCRRGYFVAGLGAAQFATSGAVDRVRDLARSAVGAAPIAGEGQSVTVLAATDPANPFGAALAWPERADPGGHRPARKAGALVVLVHGELALYVEKGGRSLLSFTDDVESLRPAADALALAVREGALGRMLVERADGAAIGASVLGSVFADAGFHATPRGLRLRG